MLSYENSRKFLESSLGHGGYNKNIPNHDLLKEILFPTLTILVN